MRERGSFTSEGKEELALVGLKAPKLRADSDGSYWPGSRPFLNLKQRKRGRIKTCAGNSREQEVNGTLRTPPKKTAALSPSLKGRT